MDQIAPGVYVSTQYPAVNVGFIAVQDGAIAIDVPTLPADARAWRQAIEETVGGRIRYVILTDAHPDRLLSAGLLGAPIIAARPAYEQALAYTDGFWRSVVEGWTRRYPASAGELSSVSVALPEMLFTGRVTLHKGDHQVTIECVAGAAPGSAWVHLVGQGILFSGDTVVIGTHPIMAAVPDTVEWLETLRSLRRERFARTIIVPGRGPLGNSADTSALSDFLTLARRRVRSLHTAGRPRAETAGLVAELLSSFPVPDEERDWIQRRVKAGLDHLYEELRQA